MICSDRGADKDEKLFATFKDRNGVVRRRGICWRCRNQRSAEYAQENFDRLQQWRKDYNQKNKGRARVRAEQRRTEIQAFLADVKAGPCTDCGARWPAVAMDFDHVRGVKIASIATMQSSARSLAVIKAEILKCELVCACCHRLRT